MNSVTRFFSRKASGLSIVFYLIPPVFFVYFVLTYTQNILVLDDYNMIGNPFIRFMEAEKLQDKISAIFSQQNEYRFPILSLIGITQFTLFDKIRFDYYPLYGNLAVFGMCALILFVYGRKQDFRKMLPVVYLMFPLHIFVIITWANASCQYLPAFFYSLLTMYLLIQENEKWRRVAFLTGFLGAFSFGSGLFGLIFGAIVLLIRKSYKFLFLWVLFSAVVFLIYFTGYKSQNLSDSSLNNLFNNTSNVVVGFLYVWGGWSDMTFTSSTFWLQTVPKITGLLTFSLIMWAAIDALLVIFRKDRQNVTALFTLAALGFLLFTTAVIAISRTGDDPEYHMLVSNHRYYSFIGLAIVYGWFLGKLTQTHRRMLLAGMVFIYAISVWKFTEAASNRAKDLAVDKFNHYNNDLNKNHRYYSEYYLFQKKVDKKLAEYGAYTFPATRIHQDWVDFDKKPVKVKLLNSIKLEVTGNGIHLLEENAGGPVLNGTYYLIRSKDNMYVYYPRRKAVDSQNPFAKSNDFEVFIDKTDVQEGVYNVLVCKYNDSVPTYFATYITWNVQHGS